MTYEKFLKLSKEDQLKILDDYAQYNFSEGEHNTWSFEYGRDDAGFVCGFEGYINNYELIKK